MTTRVRCVILFAQLEADDTRSGVSSNAGRCACAFAARNKARPLHFVQTKTKIGKYGCIQFNKNQQEDPPLLLQKSVPLGVGTHDPRLAYVVTSTRSKTMLLITAGC